MDRRPDHYAGPTAVAFPIQALRWAAGCEGSATEKAALSVAGLEARPLRGERLVFHKTVEDSHEDSGSRG